MPSDLWPSLGAILPILVLVSGACLLLLIDVFIPAQRKGLTAALAGVLLLATLSLALIRSSLQVRGFGGMVVIDPFSHFLNALLLLSGLAAVILSHDYLQRSGIERGEYYVLLLFSISGMMLMGMAGDLIIVFLALELLSIPLYVLAGIAVPRLSSEEAAIKYFLLGAFASGFFVYGTALVYGASGSTAIAQVVQVIQAGGYDTALLLIGAALILVGLGFKVAVVPFHMWTPDVYQGAPSAVSAFMAVGAKAAGFAALLRIFILVFPSLAQNLTPILWTVAALTMILGNVVAIAQRNIKRLLAYSSIAHAGYILMALVPYGQAQVWRDAVAAALFYLVGYALTNFAAWAVVIALEQTDERGLELSDYAGLGRKQPALAAAMTVAMLSFIGVPPTLGFVGKFFLFRTVIEGGFIGLALIGVITSLISAYYYLRVVVTMYMQEGEPEVRREGWLLATAYVTALGVVLVSLFAAPLIDLAGRAMFALF